MRGLESGFAQLRIRAFRRLPEVLDSLPRFSLSRHYRAETVVRQVMGGIVPDYFLIVRPRLRQVTSLLERAREVEMGLRVAWFALDCELVLSWVKFLTSPLASDDNRQRQRSRSLPSQLWSKHISAMHQPSSLHSVSDTSGPDFE